MSIEQGCSDLGPFPEVRRGPGRHLRPGRRGCRAGSAEVAGGVVCSQGDTAGGATAVGVVIAHGAPVMTRRMRAVYRTHNVDLHVCA